MPIHDRLSDVPGVHRGNGYSHAVTASGRTAYIAGQVALDENGELVGKGDLRAQTVQSLRNMEKVLLALGASWSDVIRYTWYVVDATQAQTIRDVRDEFIRPVLGDLPNPASTLMQVVSLYSPDILVEVEAVVALP